MNQPVPPDSGATDGASSTADARPPWEGSAYAEKDGQNEPYRICGNEEEGALSFYWATKGGGFLVPGSQVLFDNGNYLIIEASCRFWAYRVQQGIAITGTLNAQEREQLESALPLSEFFDMEGAYAQSLCDGASLLYWYADHAIRINAICGGSVPPLPSAVEELRSTVSAIWAETVGGTASWGGARSDGPVRFMLTEENPDIPEGAEALYYRNGKSWPLDSEPATHALSIGEAHDAGRGQGVLATGDDADALRALREAHHAGDIGFKDADFIPIVQPDGTLYQLRVRDAIPLEDDRGLLPFDFR